MTAIEHGVPVAKLTTIGTGGPARALARPRTVAELGDALRFARNEGLDVFAVGLGSNVLAADAGVDGLVLRLEGELAAVEVVGAALQAGGGATNAVCLHRARDAGLGGFEFACAIPGTAGGGVYMPCGVCGMPCGGVCGMPDIGALGVHGGGPPTDGFTFIPIVATLARPRHAAMRSRTSAALGRWAGSLASICASCASISGGSHGASWVSGAAGCEMCIARISTARSALYGTTPDIISIAIAPSE